MRKLYAFLWSMLVMCAIGITVNSAQAYNMSDYLVRTNNEPYVALDPSAGATKVPGANLNYPYPGQLSDMFSTPFSFRLCNLTGINQIQVTSNGSIICNHPGWNSSAYYSGGYQGYYDMYYPEYGYSYSWGSYEYYANYTLDPWNGGQYYDYTSSSSYSTYLYQVTGTAPNRRFIVQTTNRVPYVTMSGVHGDWQVEIFESGISTFQFNYHQRSGSTWNTTYYYYYPVTGIKSTGNYGGGFVSISASYMPPVGQAPIYSAYSVYDNNGYPLPTENFRIFLPRDYDMATESIVNPADQAIKLINQTFTPTITISNQSRLTMSSATYRMIIHRLGDSTAVYQQDVTLSSGQIPTAFTAPSTLTFPDFTPTQYGIYEDTAFVLSTTPADQNSQNDVQTSEFIVSPPNDIRAMAVLSPAPKSRTPIAVPTPVGMRFRNIGTLDETNVPLTAVIKDASGTVVYRDTVVVPSLVSGQSIDTTFKDWIPASNETYQVCGIAIMTNDQLRADDTACAPVLVRYEYDAAGISVNYPQQDQEVVAGSRWQPAGYFQSVGVSDMFDVPVRVEIHRCSDNAVVYRADSLMPELNVDQNQVLFKFPSSQGTLYDVTKLPPGCYKQCIIAKYGQDGDRTNDTACATFSIIPRLSGDIFVGVGQRFQSLHAAVDSLKFRGIQGNVRLILTDANYQENGTYTGGHSASSPFGALDFRGIAGVSDTSRITIIPRQGVTPRIVFTGNKPYCFYFGYHSPNYFKIEGYNPLGNPLPDAYTAEPNKRGMTIVDSSSAAGGIFNLEFGGHYFTARNLRLIGNGMYSNDSDAVVRLYMEPSLQTYLQGIRDTIAIHNVTIENCEIGNAAYAVRDHGSRTQYNIGKSLFVDVRNNNNTFTRNTIGSATYPLGMAGIQINNEENTTISHNEISYVNSNLSGNMNAYGIDQPSLAQLDTGNVVGIWVNANRIHNITAPGSAFGVAFQQAAVLYTVGSGNNAIRSTLPTTTRNNATNNMLFDLRGGTANYPVVYTTSANNYFTDRDSVFNNSISTNNATVNVYVANTKHAFIWNNIIQNTGTGAYTNYYIQTPRPFTGAISSDYNLFDLGGSNYTFATVREYTNNGGLIQTRNFRRLNDWRTYTNQDIHSVTGDPRFSSDSLHLPNATSYIASPASNAGAWLGSAAQVRDFDGNLRLVGNQTPDIGADEFEGYQYTNDMAVQSIVTPAGYSANSDTTSITIENPLWVTAAVKNLSSQAVFNVPVTAKVEVATNGGTWNTIYSNTTSPMNFDVNQTRNVTWQGPTLTVAQTLNSVYRVTVSVPNDQNNSNNTQVKYFRVLLKQQATVVSYDGSSTRGLQNRDSVTAALRRLGVAYDSLDRSSFGSTDIDYTPWWTLIWSSGDQNSAFNGTNPALGSGGLSFKETQEVQRFLQAGQTYAKKSLIMAGQNIAFYNDYGNINANGVTDTEFTRQYLHTKYVANSPVSGTYSSTIRGMQTDYWSFTDNLNSQSPDVVKPTFLTPAVGTEVTGIAYSYTTHPMTPSDSGAGTTYAGPTTNTVFYGFDWADATQSSPSEAGILTSGTTRVLRGALDFLTSHKGTILPVEFTDVKANRVNGNAIITWATANQKDVARFDIQMLQGNNWTNVGTVKADARAFTHTGIQADQSYTYRVVAVDLSGATTYSNSVELAPESSNSFVLSQNYPNPFNPSTSISMTLPTNAEVSLRILDMTGKVVATEIENQAMSAGTHTVNVNADALASGTYVYEMVAVQPDGQTVTLSKKMTLNK